MTEETIIKKADAFDAVPTLEDDSAHVAVVDYPWTFSNQDRPGAASNYQPEDWDMEDNERFPEILDELARPLVDGAWMFVFADDDVLPAFRRAVEETFTYRKTLIWDTERMGLGHYFRSRHGYIIAATNGDTDRRVTKAPTVFEAPAPQRQPGRADTYPTEKPARLLEEMLRPVTSPGERVIEPFCGSAPALEAARTLDLRYWGVDVSDDALRRARSRGEQTRLTTATDGGRHTDNHE
ncbi:ORF10 [Halogeometricum pleomorphic virus 1]|uniref:ORF10 n=1 Tax=Halogeometricum pleomorphic virus 1 TaxID=1156722 RepID=H9ABR1_9VIRU|nr:ORF10 [Halogeometricum pleomorphic virus 1]AFD04031.1 ORF10 [Halogeometricum pleomorphic virus 1]